MNVDNYNCFMKLLIHSTVATPFNMKTYPPTKGNPEIAQAIIELSKLKYGRDKDIVNSEIMERTRYTTPKATADAFDMGEKAL
jgi:hypothetical protein